MRFTGKNVVVTGGARGIGRAIALAFANEGGEIVILDKSDEDAYNTAKDIEALDSKVLVMRVDAKNVDQVKNSINSLNEKLGGIDILINNIGWNNPVPFLESKESLWYEIVELNLMVTMRFCHSVLPHMIKRQQGVIINMSSVQGKKASNAVPYAAAKAGVISVTRSLAKAVAQHNIRVNAVCPGVVESTELYKQVMRDNPEYAKSIIMETPMGRPCQPEEVSAVVLFLASEESSYMTGQSLSVDGGIIME